LVRDHSILACIVYNCPVNGNQEFRIIYKSFHTFLRTTNVHFKSMIRFAAMLHFLYVSSIFKTLGGLKALPTDMLLRSLC